MGGGLNEVLAWPPSVHDLVMRIDSLVWAGPSQVHASACGTTHARLQAWWLQGKLACHGQRHLLHCSNKLDYLALAWLLVTLLLTLFLPWVGAIASAFLGLPTLVPLVLGLVHHVSVVRLALGGNKYVMHPYKVS